MAQVVVDPGECWGIGIGVGAQCERFPFAEGSVFGVAQGGCIKIDDGDELAGCEQDAIVLICNSKRIHSCLPGGSVGKGDAGLAGTKAVRAAPFVNRVVDIG